ncbi:MAG TPA: alpha/beta hydrolase, partial [Ignavibacteriaceae bacterium]
MKKIINDLSVFLTGSKKFKAILFIHGFPFDHTMWQTQVEELSKEYLCVTYDIRGLGESAVRDGQFTIESFVDDLESIVDELNLDKPILCALSMGGYISLRAVERMQDKFSALILCDTKAGADDNQGKLKRAVAIKQINRGDFENFIDTFVINCFGEKFSKKNNAEFRNVIDRSKKNNPIGAKGCLLAMAGRTDTTENLPKINIPTLIICGSEDKLSPPNVMKAMSEKIPNSRFVLVEDAGHMTPMENPQRVNS